MDFGDGTQVFNSLSVSHAWQNWGYESVVFTVFNDSNPGGISATDTIFVLPQNHTVSGVFYVSANMYNPQLPYTNWATAAVNIQDAVNFAAAGSLIWVTNGVYAGGGSVASSGLLTNRVAVTVPITVESVNGPAVTIIQGHQVAGTTNGSSAVRCAYLTNGASLVGFSLVNGATLASYSVSNADYEGGGAWCVSTNAVISNCIIANNTAQVVGGGIFSGALYNCTVASNAVILNGAGLSGGGTYQGFMINCIIIGNYSAYGGGAYGGTLINCQLVSNSAAFGAGAYGSSLISCQVVSNSGGNAGGGAYNCMLTNCTLIGNSGGFGGGAYLGTLADCSIVSNTASRANGGGAYAATLQDCLIAGNSSAVSYAGGGTFGCVLSDCTVVSNSASYGGGTAAGTNNNCIIMFNNATSGLSNNFFGDTLNYCDTAPLPSGGTGNIAVNPQLSDAYHITALSPCRGAGSSAYSSGTDLDGEPWLNPPSIGCDEYYGLGPLSVGITAAYTNVVAGLPRNFTGVFAGSVSSVVWNFGDGSTATNALTVAHGWQIPGNYTLTLTVYNVSNPGGVSASIGVQVVAQQVYYVSQASTNPVSPYSSWATAATNIQDAVDATSTTPGELVLVSNGVYNIGGRVVPPFGLTNRLVVTNPVIIQSVNGPAVTIIQGVAGRATNAVRCVWLGNNAALAGFTLANGGSLYGGDETNELSGAGVWCATASAVVSNCLIISNTAYCFGGGAYGGSLINCCFTGNRSYEYGGGTWQSTLKNCLVVSNRGYYGGGALGGTLNNCLITDNIATIGGGALGSTLVNCTVVTNSASSAGGGAYSGVAVNSILVSNSSPTGSNYYLSTLNYCCTMPLPTSGVGNISTDPMFANFTNGNFRLQSNSPCINAGNNVFVVGATDLDGNPRISGGTVDMGAYEYQNPASTISYAWLQQYGLATDGSADFADTDGNGMNNWQKWVAGLNPTNAASVLQVLSPVASGTNLVVTWQSVTNINYFLQRSSSLAPGSFQTIVTNIAGQAGTTSYADTNAPAPGPWFYRVGVP